jgi:hypothetical protein
MKSAILLLWVLAALGASLAWVRVSRANQATKTTLGCTVPKAWGQYRGPVGLAGAVFEDSSGMLRILKVDQCEQGKTELDMAIYRN